MDSVSGPAAAGPAGRRALGEFQTALIIVLACTVVLIVLMFYLGVRAGRHCRAAARPRSGKK